MYVWPRIEFFGGGEQWMIFGFSGVVSVVHSALFFFGGGSQNQATQQLTVPSLCRQALCADWLVLWPISSGLSREKANSK